MQVQFEKIPQYLKNNGKFCNWRYKLRDGSQTKVPYMSGTKRKANVDNPTTFVAFDTAASATGYDGIRASGGIVGIDLDHCIEDGKLLPWTQAIVDRFNVTYIEISPSGEGICIFCLLPSSFVYDTQTYHIKKGNIEVYIPGHTNRFLTITGNAITVAPVTETADALTWLLDTYMCRPTPPTPAVVVPGKATSAVMRHLQSRRIQERRKVHPPVERGHHRVQEPKRSGCRIGTPATSGRAEVGVSADAITYEDVVKLFFSVKSEYRRNGVWLMNDETAPPTASRKENAPPTKSTMCRWSRFC